MKDVYKLKSKEEALDMLQSMEKSVVSEWNPVKVSRDIKSIVRFIKSKVE